MNRTALIETAILGLERHPLPPEAAEAALPGDDDAAALLRAIARMHYSEKVAHPIQNAPPLPPPDTGPAGNPIGPRSARHLASILYGRHIPAWDEFADTLLCAGRAVSPEAVPALLQRAAESPASAEKILSLCGSRGAWLAAQVPRWQKLYARPELESWPMATLDDRILILRQLRTPQPEAGLQLLLSTWTEDGPHERQMLLSELRSGLSRADEPFLEACLDDKRQEIRRAAAALLSSMPDSALSARLFEYVSGLWDKKRNIHPPESLPSALLRDGIEAPASGKAGAKAELLRRLFSRITPQKWETFFSEAPAAIIRRFEKSDWATPIVSGLAEAIALHQNAGWADAMLLRLSEKQGEPDFDIAKGLVQHVSPDGLEQVVTAQLITNRGIILNNSAAAIMLNSAPHPWPERMALQFIDGFRKWLWQTTSQDWSMTHYKQLLRTAAYRCPVHRYDQLEQDWPVQSKAWYFWEKDVQYFLRGVGFRKEMLEALLAV